MLYGFIIKKKGSKNYCTITFKKIKANNLLEIQKKLTQCSHQHTAAELLQIILQLYIHVTMHHNRFLFK